MAEPQSSGTARQEQANEARLRAARRESPPGGDQPGPSMSDQAAAQAKQMRNRTAATDEAAAQNIERRQGITQKAGVQIDRKRIEYTPETKVGDMTISRGRQVTDREEMGAGARGGFGRQQRLENQLNRQRRQEAKPEQEGGNMRAPSLRDAAALAKATPAGATAGTLLKAGAGQGLSTAEIQKGVGRGCVMQLWSFLWPSFGHTIYLLVLIFWIAWASKFARKYVPAVGEEWFPSQLLQRIPKPMLIPIKMAEIVGLFFILFWVLMLDLLCIGILAFLLGAIMDVANLL